MFSLAQRALLALCLISLFSCSGPCCRQWEIHKILTKYPCFNGGRITLCPDSNYSHLELELVRNRSGIRFYINLLFLQAQPWKEDPTRTRVEVLFEDKEPWIIYPYLLEGGQRMLLPGDIADTLIQYLLDDYPFSIKIGRTQIEVITDNFATVYGYLLALPIEEVVEN